MAEAFEGWGIVELMGHRRVAGRVSEVEQYGATMLRVDVPQGDDWVTQFYGGSAIYCLTPTTEAIARQVAVPPEPAHAWELRALTAGREETLDALILGTDADDR